MGDLLLLLGGAMSLSMLAVLAIAAYDLREPGAVVVQHRAHNCGATPAHTVALRKVRFP